MQAQSTKPRVKPAVSLDQSTALIRNLVRAGISEVCWLRNLFVSEHKS